MGLRQEKYQRILTVLKKKIFVLCVHENIPSKSVISSKMTSKVEVRLMATGDAPIMKQKNYKVDNEKKIEWIIAFIRKYLKLEDSESLFVYVNQAFSPSPDQSVGNLCECFGSEGKLVLYYSKTQAWG